MGKGQKSEVQKKRKSRDAARQRRGQQNDEFSELASHLPLPVSVSTQLDRLCIMRLTNSYVKIKHVIKQLMATTSFGGDIKPDPEMCLYDSSALDALGGFVFVVSMDGQCVYTSPNVVDYLGISQLEMTGCSMYKFVHPCDQEELAKQLDGQVPLEDMEIFDGLFCSDNGPLGNGVSKTVIRPETKTLKSTFRSFFLRMKSTITSRGKSVNLNASIFRVVHCLGSVHFYCTSYDKSGDGVDTKYLISIGTPLLSSDSFEVPLDRMTFTTTHGLDMKLLSCEEKMSDLLGFTPVELAGKSWYCFTHACDTDILKNCHKIVLSKGQGISGYYRMMTKSGGWVWMQTKGNVVYSNVSFQPQYIICVNYLLSGKEAEDQLLSSEQTAGLSKLVSCHSGPRKREPEEKTTIEEPAIKMPKSDSLASLTPPYSDDEVEAVSFDVWPTCIEDQVIDLPCTIQEEPGEIYIPTSGEQDMQSLQNHQEDYEDKLVEEYSIHLDDDDDDFDEELPSLEFVDMSEELDGMSLPEKSIDELLEDEAFLARAPFIPPPTVDEMLTSLLDVNGVDSDEDDVVYADEYESRAPYIPDTMFDVPLSFDELESSPLPFVPEFEESDIKMTKINSKDIDNSSYSKGKKRRGRKGAVEKEKSNRGGKIFGGGGKQQEFYNVGATSVPRQVIENSLREKARGMKGPTIDLTNDDSKELPAENKFSFRGKGKYDQVKTPEKVQGGKAGVNVALEALVFGRLSAMPYITNDDAEVNAPAPSLLQGTDLLRALDYVA